MKAVEDKFRTATKDRARLDADSIIEAGLRIAAQPRTATVTVRELGAVLDAAPTAIYRHFRSKEGLMQALIDRLLAMCMAKVTAPREDWRGRLMQLSTATLETFLSYPAIGLEAIVLSTEGPAEIDTIETMLDALAQTGLEGEELVRHYATIATYVISYASGIAREHAFSPSMGRREPQPWIGRPLPVTAASHPRINSLREELTALRDHDIFFAGITELLDSAERAGAEAKARTVQAPSA